MFRNLLLAAILLAPLTQAHVPSTPIDSEDHLIQDEWTDNGVWDGFDILDVHVREAHFPGMDGVVFRWSLYGGSTGGYLTEHAVTLSFSNANTLTWTSSDDGATWEGPGPILAATRELEDIPVVNVQFQGFVSYETLGVGVNESLDDAFAAAYVNDLLVDEAPGPYHLYGVPITDPTAAPDPMRLIDSLVLDGPDRYTKSTVRFEEGMLFVDVDNLITTTGQHVLLLADQASLTSTAFGTGNIDPSQGSVYEAEPGQDVNFTATFEDFDVLEVRVRSDLGGLETFYVGSDGTVRDTPFELAGQEPMTEESPLPVALLLVALVVAARRRA